MAHELEVVGGKAMMAYTKSGGIPWHGLGTPVEDCVSPEQMLKIAGLDWTVEKIPTFYEHNGVRKETGKQALIRNSDGRLLSVVSDDWEPIQNSDAFEFFTEFTEAGSMTMETAGSIHNGEIVWALAKTGEDFVLNTGDRVEGYLHFTNFHRYGCSTDIRFTPVRVVCKNTLSQSLGTAVANKMKYSHRNTFDPNVAKEALKIASTKLLDYKEMAEFLAATRVTDDAVKAYFMTVFPRGGDNDEGELSRSAKRALEVLNVQPGAEYSPGTAWNAANAVTFLVDHVIGRNVNTRLGSAWYGNGSKLKQFAMDQAVEMAKAA